MRGSVSEWISNLREGDAEAARQLWIRYSPDLIEVCRKRLARIPRDYVDEDDIAQSVFQCMCTGLSRGQFEELEGRDDLWWLLVAMTMRKVAGHAQSQMAVKRGGGRVRTESSLSIKADETLPFRVDSLTSEDPPPEAIVILQEQHAYLLARLGSDGLRNVAEYRIAGYSIQEISDMLSLSTRSVERKLRLIRDTWKAALYDVC
jgi:DNA-directed RNA polymerase specialized sigma24 family protein